MRPNQITTIVFSFLIACGSTVSITQDAFAQNLMGIRQEVPFQLQINQTGYLESKEIKIQLLNVTADSRCPSDVTCIWEGQVKVLVGISKGLQNIGNFTLDLSSDKTLAIHTFDNYFIQVIDVKPYPISTKKISPSDYIVILKLSSLTPLKLSKVGIPADKITCGKDLVLMIKNADGSPACVRPTSATRLESRGWILGPYSNASSMGLLTGTVTFYPCSPVEQIGSPACTGNGRNFTITVYQSDVKTAAGQTSSDQSGVYSLELQEGKYLLFIPYSSISPNQGKLNPVHIEANKTTIFNIEIDSGIR